MSGSLTELSEEFEDVRAEIGDIEAQIERLPMLQERRDELAVLIKQMVSDPRPVDLEAQPTEGESEADELASAVAATTPENLSNGVFDYQIADFGTASLDLPETD